MAYFPPGTKYRVVPSQDGDYTVEIWVPGEAPYAALTGAEKEEALDWILAEQNKTLAAEYKR